MPFGNLNYERWQCEAGCAAVINLIFGKQQEIWEVELDWRDIFPVRRLSREPAWHQQNAGRPPLGTDKQLCHSIAAQSDQTEKRPVDRCHTEPNSEPGGGQNTQKNAVQILTAVPPSAGPLWLRRGAGKSQRFENIYEIDSTTDEWHNSATASLFTYFHTHFKVCLEFNHSEAWIPTSHLMRTVRRF